ncbi:DUF2087 domain-containing protein [Pararhodobacter zhoushanensis]|uniref:DUF2087 domain-containing protein n=1 Tax=Pararhodobacter zhoushanensis TaxID=2479545 RepID=A0ABT3H4Y3_9RHOB|nr:DUF2087 domain-containing protein [Pararhodobacter zhoushanensis]MCW1934861.1 DUF2087 domain-containing protein [Pararhodobacter zhoushanensis]
MSRDLIPLTTPDVSAFARQLSRQLDASGPAPSHLAMLNMLARSAGFRNHQHLRAAHAAEARLSAPAEPSADFRQVERALACFDGAGQLIRWPAWRQLQILCLWALWSRLPRDLPLDEAAINRLLDGWHSFGDRALLRRDMIGLGLMQRAAGGRDYRRVEQRPSVEARALIRQVTARLA